MFRPTHLAAGLLALLLAACTPYLQQSEPADQFLGHGEIRSVAFIGRIAVRQPSGADSGRIEWKGSLQDQQVSLLSPLGSTVALLTRNPGQVSLELSDHRKYSASDAETLTQDVLGYSLPLAGLPWWVLGEPAPQDRAETWRDDHGRLAKLVQSGWTVDYDRWRRVGARELPGTVGLKRGELAIRLIIEQWQVQGDRP